VERDPLPPVAELCRLAEVEEEASALHRDGMAPQDLVATLVAHERYPDAVGLLAHALPTREAIWWAWLCARKAADLEPAPPLREALQAVERWIVEPVDEHRRAAGAVAEAVDLSTPAGCAALAVFLSGGSLAPPGMPPVEPPPYSAAKALAGGVILAAVGAQPERAPERFRAFIAQGVEVGRRLQLWPGGDDSAARIG